MFELPPPPPPPPPDVSEAGAEPVDDAAPGLALDEVEVPDSVDDEVDDFDDFDDFDDCDDVVLDEELLVVVVDDEDVVVVWKLSNEVLTICPIVVGAGNVSSETSAELQHEFVSLLLALQQYVPSLILHCQS